MSFLQLCDSSDVGRLRAGSSSSSRRSCSGPRVLATQRHWRPSCQFCGNTSVIVASPTGRSASFVVVVVGVVVVVVGIAIVVSGSGSDGSSSSSRSIVCSRPTRVYEWWREAGCVGMWRVRREVVLASDVSFAMDDDRNTTGREKYCVLKTHPP